MNPALLESALDNVLFNLLDRDRRRIDTQHTGRFARSGTDSSSKFGKVIGRVQLAHRFLPAPAIHQIIPVGNQIVDRAAGMAEGHAAIHAARALVAQFLLWKLLIDFEPVVHPLGDRAARSVLP